MVHTVSLSSLMPGERARVKELLSEGSIRRRLLDLGLIEGTTVQCVHIAPGGSPIAYLIRGAVIALRSCDADNIYVFKEGEGL